MTVTLFDLGYAFWFIFPAYCANAAPILFGGGAPLDAGKLFFDEKPILGSHKTIRGFLSGLILGTSVGFLQSILLQDLLVQYDPRFHSGILLGFILSLGAMIGDSFESFIKRRLNLPPGGSLPVADQLDFVAGAIFFSVPFNPPTLDIVLLIVLITIPMHLFTNFLANKLRIKRNRGLSVRN